MLKWKYKGRKVILTRYNFATLISYISFFFFFLGEISYISLFSYRKRLITRKQSHQKKAAECRFLSISMQFGTFLQPPTRAKGIISDHLQQPSSVFYFSFLGYMDNLTLHPINTRGISHSLFSLDHYGSLRFFTTRYGIQSLQKFAFKLLPFNSWTTHRMTSNQKLSYLLTLNEFSTCYHILLA